MFTLVKNRHVGPKSVCQVPALGHLGCSTLERSIVTLEASQRAQHVCHATSILPRVGPSSPPSNAPTQRLTLVVANENVGSAPAIVAVVWEVLAH